jgi:ABC-type nitrate/sulfonate/bicarbonate transport system permease component
VIAKPSAASKLEDMSSVTVNRPQLMAPVVTRTAVIVGLLAVWEAACRLGLVDPFTAPSPFQIGQGFVKIVEAGELGQAFVRTLIEAFGAAAIGAMLGIALGFWLHNSRVVGLAYTSWVAAAASAPLVLLYPLFLVIFGRNSSTIIAMGALGCLPPITLKAKEGLDGVRPVLLNVGRAFNLTRRQQFWMIMFPAALPVIFTGIRIGLLFAIINVVGVEFLIAFGGLGELISDLGDRFDYPAMYAAIFFVVLVSVACFYVTEKLEKWLL